MEGLKVKAMLAYKVGKKDVSQEDWDAGVYIQPKLDGVRCIFQKDGAYSRNGKRWMNIQHIEERLAGFFREYPNLILDGELYNHKFCNDFEKIISLVRKTKPSDEDRIEAAELVQFHIYDVITPAGGLKMPIITGENSNDNYFRRNGFIKANFGAHKAPGCFKTLKFDLVNSYDQALIVHRENLRVGYEGSILRLNKRYEQKRSYTLQKFKDFHDAEATIIDFVEGKGKREGTLGKFLMQDDKGVKFGCPPGKGYNHDMLRSMLIEGPDFIGKRATFTFFERTKVGSYRHPMFKTIRDYE